ncbi:colicin E3/pyocin S6 family cytotoxin [Bacillus cabrialesii]|uniref:colicin E3/pyocin S6 family cytotoxin n=1 Tax=Bacillus cabrialesii TaxID=2487276 RepID=UPI003D21018E
MILNAPETINSVYKFLNSSPTQQLATVTFTGINIWGALSDSWKRDMVNGDAESRSRWITYSLATVVTALIGTKGVDKVGKLGTLTAKKTITKGSKALVTTSEMFSNMLSSRTNQFAFAGDLQDVHNVLNTELLKDVSKKESVLFQSNSGKSPTNSSTFDVTSFEKKMYSMNINEKIAFIRETAAPIAKQNGWKKDSKLSTINKRDVYYDSKSKTYYALDTQHGRFEVLNKRGKHQGEVDFNLNPTKEADKSGGHDLRMK